MICARRRHPAFGLGTFTDLGGSNPTVLSYVREHIDADGTEDLILCVNNLSRFPQPVELDLRRYEGRRPVEMLGGVPFPEIGELPYLLTLAGYGFYWFRLTAPDSPEPVLYPGRDEPMTLASHRLLRASTSKRTRWFGGKGRPSRSPPSALSARCPQRHRDYGSSIDLVEVTYDAEGGREFYQVPLAFYDDPETPPRPRLHRLVGGRDVRLGARVRRPARPRRDGAVAAGLRPRRGRGGGNLPTRRRPDASTGCPATTWT